ncbi:hypothetical protein LguiA_021534 [Lonicera macranthoides]
MLIKNFFNHGTPTLFFSQTLPLPSLPSPIPPNKKNKKRHSHTHSYTQNA